MDFTAASLSAVPLPSTPLVEVSNLSKRFGGLVAVDRVSFAIMPRAITALIGPNGAGKTTVFNCLTGFYRPSSGVMTAHKNNRTHNLARLPAHKIPHKAGLARTFQNIRLFKNLSVLENVLAALHRPLMKSMLGGFMNTPSYQRAQKVALEKARFWLEALELADAANEEAGRLPYGAQRRLEIARALAMEPQLLCLDEPAAGLNPKESAALAAFLKNLRDAHGLAILLIEHDMSVVMGICDHVVVLDHGVKIAEGKPDDVRHDPEVIRAYLGDA